ncbi:MAG: DUF1761 domain-containing protein [Nanoarchaeota archaeon]|nr:DUF1761 domain-containing protein [Nanoarchaeota archaeon]
MNYLAVLVAGIVGLVVAMIWYAPFLFGKAWIKLAKVKMDKKGRPARYFMALIKTLVMAWFIALFLEWLGIASVAGGLVIGFWLWLGFVGTTTFSGVIWGKKPFKLWLLDNGANLLSILIMAAILGVWI